MVRHRERAGLALLGLLVLTCFVLGQDSKKEDPAAQDQQVVSSKASKKPAGASVNFRKELNLPYATLGSLGARIRAARKSHDPVALANAANELAVAEKVSGKKASMTSQMLIKEAAELGSYRKQKTELQATLHVANQIAADEETVKRLKQEIADAETIAKADQQSIAGNEEPTWAPRKVVVNNYTTQYLDIYVNGRIRAQVDPGGQQTIVIEHRWNPTVLTATGDQDIDHFGPRYIWGRFSKYTWNIN